MKNKISFLQFLSRALLLAITISIFSGCFIFKKGHGGKKGCDTCPNFSQHRESISHPSIDYASIDSLTLLR